MLGQAPSFSQGIKIVSHCPLCESQYDITQTRVLEEQDDAQLVHITCTQCKAGVLAVILLNQNGVSSIGLVSDLQTFEVSKFKTLNAITADEVLNLHKTLKKHTLNKILEL